MTTAAIYDIHGNLPALEAVLAELHRLPVESLVVGGDVVPGPMPRETLTTLFELDIPVHFIRGNGETAVLAEGAGIDSGVPDQFREVIRWTADRIYAEFEQLLVEWPMTRRLQLKGIGEVLFCHATPRSENEIFTKSTPENVLLPVFDRLGVDVVVCGHTHMQFDRLIGTTRIINAGSVGMPFGQPGAYWLTLSDTLELRHTRYDLAEAAERILATAYPQADHFVRNHVVQCPTEPEMLAAFAKAELR